MMEKSIDDLTEKTLTKPSPFKPSTPETATGLKDNDCYVDVYLCSNKPRAISANLGGYKIKRITPTTENLSNVPIFSEGLSIIFVRHSGTNTHNLVNNVMNNYSRRFKDYEPEEINDKLKPQLPKIEIYDSPLPKTFRYVLNGKYYQQICSAINSLKP